MKITLLKNYKNNIEFYHKFITDELINDGDYLSDTTIEINVEVVPDFPIYYSRKDDSKREKLLLEAVHTIADSYLNIPAEYIENELFWHSLFCLYKRDYILKEYPVVNRSYEDFKNIVIKNFNWESYVYKSVLCAKYITQEIKIKSEQDDFYRLINNNFDLFNYIIKYPIFRNGHFLVTVLKIIKDESLGPKLKGRISNKESGKDLRRGRQVIYEFNKSYPMLLSPMLEYDVLKQYFIKFLSLYE